MTPTTELRSHLLALLEWHDAHVTFEKAVAGLDPQLVVVRRLLGAWG